jgi:flavin reductase (DIM6/NTAB) family NADH-FMN oxidoreductase RutF
VDAPYVREFPLVVECRVKETVELGSHTMFIGEIVDVKADPSILNADGVPVVEQLKPFVYAPGSGTFYGLGPALGKVADLAATAESDGQ